MWNFVINVKLFHVLSSNIQNNEFSRTIICPCPPVSTLRLAMTCDSPLAVGSAWPGVTTRPRVMNNNSPNHRNLETIYTEIYCFNQLNTCFPKPLKPTQLDLRLIPSRLLWDVSSGEASLVSPYILCTWEWFTYGRCFDVLLSSDQTLGATPLSLASPLTLLCYPWLPAAGSRLQSWHRYCHEYTIDSDNALEVWSWQELT